MKKTLSILLTLVMVVGFGSFTLTGAAAKTGDTDDQSVWNQNRGGLHKLAGMYQQEGQPDTDDPKAKEVIVQFADSGSADVSAAEAAKIETIEAMAEEDNAAKGSKEVEIADGISVQQDEVWEFDNGDGDPLTVALASSENLSTEKMIKRLQSNNMVVAVSPNYSRRICSEHDPYRDDYQWALGAYPGIGVDSEWDGEGKNVGSEDVIVAVVDTGIYYDHPDLQGQMWQNPYGKKLLGKCGFDFAYGDTDPKDDNGHGTHCAGIIGAATNGIGTQGVNQKVSLMALKVLDEDGGGYDSDIIAAYNYVYKALKLGANVKAVSCSFGGDEENEIMGEVIDKIGKFEKKDKDGNVIQTGAVTVCAAGNEATDSDEYPSFPACYDSEYIISVAATKDCGDKAELVSFSNYGEETVDIAAPGTDILSTVSYDCFNPTLYGNDMGIVQTYLDGSDITPLTDAVYSNIDPADITATPEAGFFSDKGIRIRFTAPEGNKKQLRYVALPYQLPEDYDITKGQDIYHSMMIKTLEGPQELTIDDYFNGTFCKVMILDVPQSFLTDEEFLKTDGLGILMNYMYDYQIVAGDDDYWTHIATSMLIQDKDGHFVGANDDPDEEFSKDRALLIMADCQLDDFTAYIDDIGISQPTADTSAFEKYDFYSGTSMATPYVAGAAALMAASNLETPDYGPDMLVGDIMSMANDSNPLKVGKKTAVGTEGAVDFAYKGQGFWVGISSVTVDTAKDQIILKGKFDDGNVELKIKKSDSSDEAKLVPEEDFISRSPSEIVLKNDGWANNIIDITVSKTKEGKTKTSTKRDVYVVKGKKEYKVFDEGSSMIGPNAAVTTNGKLIYAAQSQGDSIMYMNPSNKYFETDEIMTFSKKMVKKYFSDANNLSKTANYDFRFGDDLVKIGKYFYVEASFCEVANGGWDDGDDWSHSNSLSSGDSDDDEDRFQDSTGPAYAEESYIFKIDASTGKVAKKLPWPKDADLLTDSKLASYNGVLYLLGGINEGTDSFSNKVYSYNATKNKWTAKAALPQGRAGGKVLQTGNTLVYTLGYCEESKDLEQAPANFVFNGSKWIKKKATLTPLMPSWTTVSRGNKEYTVVDGSVGICAGGLVYIGAPVEDYGDTFTYNVSKDTYTAMGYNYTKDLYDVEDLYYGDIQIGGLAVGNRIVGFDDENNIVGINKAITSGLVTVKTSMKNGTMKGKGTYMPGTTCTVKAIAKPGYYVTSLRFAGKKSKPIAKGMSATALVTRNVTAKATTAKVKVTAVKSLTLKPGKSGSLKAKITSSAAAKQWKLAYKSSNKKYATVNAKGKVTAKKAGKGKTVKIKIMLKGTSKTMKTVKVKIKK